MSQLGQFFGPIGYLFNLIFTFPIFNALMLIYRVVGDFGLSIIILTLVVKLVLFPLTLKQLKSMKATQALAPQMAALKKKYPNDPQALFRAQQELNKEYGISPIAGTCLPTLVQMPVLFGLFYALSAVLRSAHTVGDINNLIYPFLPRFLTFPNVNLDWFTFINHSWFFALNQPDPTHILPILAAVATFIQMRMSQQRATATTANDPMRQQMIIMQLISPVMVLIFGWTYAAGLALYWTTSSLFAMVQQYFVTGWGSLLVIPNLVSNKDNGSNNNRSNGNGKVYTGDSAKETKVLARANEPEGQDGETGPVGSKLNKSGSSSGRRKSASARRRSSNNPVKKNVSRGYQR